MVNPVQQQPNNPSWNEFVKFKEDLANLWPQLWQHCGLDFLGGLGL